MLGPLALHSPANTFTFIGPRYSCRKEVALQSLNKLTWPTKRESVGRRVQEASGPRTAHQNNVAQKKGGGGWRVQMASVPSIPLHFSGRIFVSSFDSIGKTSRHGYCYPQKK
ncbi:hypothetical protein SLA2020_153450 [Shorea laevis]